MATPPQSTVTITNNTGATIVIDGVSIANGAQQEWTGANFVVLFSDWLFRICLLAGTISIEANGQEITSSVAMSSPVFSGLLDDVISGQVQPVA
jgi:hypothetical protein